MNNLPKHIYYSACLILSGVLQTGEYMSEENVLADFGSDEYYGKLDDLSIWLLDEIFLIREKEKSIGKQDIKDVEQLIDQLVTTYEKIIFELSAEILKRSNLQHSDLVYFALLYIQKEILEEFKYIFEQLPSQEFTMYHEGGIQLLNEITTWLGSELMQFRQKYDVDTIIGEVKSVAQDLRNDYHLRTFKLAESLSS
jgi:hypothetical protein